ncbi:MAG: hypothetical protein NVV72_11505 [Asticcacaulis sp.]|nr:hypothetical protein [Asticcacaulis sp.]
MLAKRFLWQGNQSSPPENQHPVPASKILSRLDEVKSGSFEQPRYVLPLRVSYLHGDHSGRFEICLRLCRYRSVRRIRRPIGAAIKGSRRIEIPDLALQGR